MLKPARLSLVTPCLALSVVLPSPVAYAAHPLQSDDTGTQGSSHWQLEVNTDHYRTRQDGGTARVQMANATLTYGATDTLDIAVNLPYQRQRAPASPLAQGMGDATLQAKWRFVEQHGWSWALKPAVTLPTGNADKGLGNGRSTASLNLLGQYQKEAFTWLVNAGASWNPNTAGNHKHLWNASTAVLYAPVEAVQLVGDIGISRNPDASANSSKTLSYALVGAIYHVSKTVDLDAGYRRSLQRGPVTHGLGAGLTVRW